MVFKYIKKLEYIIKIFLLSRNNDTIKQNREK